MRSIKFLIGSALLLTSTFLMAQSNQFNYNNQYSNPQFNQSSPSQATGKINWLNNYQEAASLSQSTSKPIILLFTGTGWCPACVKLEREVLHHPAFANAVGQNFIFLKAEFPDYSEMAMMNSPYKPLLDRYNINSFPTIVVIDATGHKLYTVNYQNGGPEVYARELLQKLNQFRNNSIPHSSSSQFDY